MQYPRTLASALTVLVLAAAGTPPASAHQLTPLASPNPKVSGNFGGGVAVLPDVDGDGTEDFAVGARIEDGGPTGSGRAYVFSGASGELLHSLTSPNAETAGNFGQSVAGVPDADGDAFGDVLVNTYYESPTTIGGRAYLFSGATGALLQTFVSPAPQSFGNFGSTISGIPDVTGDGRGDVIIGAPNELVGNNPGAGNAYIFNGATGALVRTIPSATGESNRFFAQDVSGIDDLNDDGFGDVIISDYQTGQSTGGLAYVYSGATGAQLYPLTSPGGVAFGGFGRAFSGVPDVNGDGFGDIIVGADGEPNPGNNDQSGRAYVFSGANGGLLHTLASPNPSMQGKFGTSVSGVSDVNGDGHGDVLVGANENAGADRAGRAYLFSGADGALLETYASPAPELNGYFGSEVGGARFATGNASAHVVGAYLESSGGLNDAGNVYYTANVVALAVNSTGDDDDSDPGDGVCWTGNLLKRSVGPDAQECTLRAAITHSNAQGGERITFDIEGAGPHRILAASALGEVTAGAEINATTQPGYFNEPMVIVDGIGAGLGATGLLIRGEGSKVSGLGIDGFDGSGVVVEAPGVTITRMHIGVENGNGGHGIVAQGDADNLQIGVESDPQSGNVIGNSGGNGIYLNGPDESQIGKAGVSAMLNIKIAHNMIGMILPPNSSVPTAIGNALSGMALKNIANASILKNIIGNSQQHGVELMGSLTTGNSLEGNDVGGWFMRAPDNTLQEAQPMGNLLSGIYLHSGAFQNLIGRVGGRPNTVVASGRYGLRMVESSQNTVVGSLFGVPADSIETAPGKNGGVEMIAFRNLLGGLCLENSFLNSIGLPGAGNIISNNGSVLEHAGVILTGIASKQNKISSNFIGTNGLGHLLGNIGSGVLVTDGADETTIGGDTEDEGNKIGGNTGNGIYLRGQSLEQSMTAETVAAAKAGLRPAAAGTSASINLGNITNNVIGALFVGDNPVVIPNLLNGICMQNAFRTLTRLNTIAGNKKSGIELFGPLSTENVFEGNALGGLARWASVQGPEDVFAAGNEEHGVHLHSEAFKNIFKAFEQRRQVAVANHGYAMLLAGSHLNKMNEMSIGIIRNLRGPAGKQARAADGSGLINLGNALGGLCILNSANNQIGAPNLGNIFANNGTDTTDAAIELKGLLTIGTKILGNLIGTTPEGETNVGNSGPGILIDQASETTIGGMDAGSANVVVGNGAGAVKGFLAKVTNMVGNYFGQLSDANGGTPIPNLGRTLSFIDSRVINVGGNKMTGDTDAVLAILRSNAASAYGNLVKMLNPAATEPAVLLRDARDVTMDAGAMVDPSWFGPDPGRNEIIAHEAVHVVQSDRVKVSGLDVEAPEQAADATAKAVLFQGSTNVTSGSLQSGNNLLLNGGNGVVFEESRGTATATNVSGANDAVLLEASEVRLQSMRLQESTRAITAILQSQMEVQRSIIRNMRGSNSGIHMENSSGSISGTTITGDAGDAIWLSGSNPTINGNNIEGNTGFGIRNVDPAITVDATGNWWGDASGPGGEGPGNGDEVSERVNFAGWLNSQIGLLVSTDPDSVVVIPGAHVIVDAAVQNLVNPSDQADIDVDDDAGWVTSETSFSVATDTDPAPFEVTLQVPITAANGATNAVTIDAGSQATPALTGAAEVVLVVATAQPTATATVAAAATNVELFSDGPSGPARVAITANDATVSSTLRLFDLDGDSRLSTTTTDDRVLSPDQTVVRPTSALADAVWAVQSDVATAATGKSPFSAGTSPASAYTFEACFDVQDHLDDLGNVDRAVVLFRAPEARAWSARTTTLRNESASSYLCAAHQTEFGYFSLAAADEAAPSPPVTAFPDPDRTGVESDPTFAWRTATGATRYEFELSLDTSFDNPIANVTTTAPYHAVSGLAVSTPHYWRVRSGSALGFGPWSPVSAFTTSATGVEIEDAVEKELPADVALSPNYPNPFRGRTTITYQLPEPDRVRLEVYDLQGRLVAILADGEVAAGEHHVTYDAAGRASGVYFIRLTTPGATRVEKMVVM